MQVISGKYKNKKIRTIKSNSTRPTISRVREDIFNILQNYFIYENKVVVDIFAGSGSIGIEFLSRGSKECYFNDKSKEAFKIIQKNLKNLTDSNYKVYNLDYILFLNYFKSLNKTIDVFILDPPFDEKDYYYKVFDYIIKYKLLNIYAIIIIESQFEIDFEKYIKKDNWATLKFKKYKYRHLYIMRKNDEND